MPQLRDAFPSLLQRQAGTQRDLEVHRQAWVNDPRFGGFVERDFATEWIQVDDPPLTAYINHGRWVADCPFCIGGIAIPMAQGTNAACYDCGRIFTTIDRPEGRELQRAVQALLKRPGRETQNWERQKGQDSDWLIADNIARGIK